MDINWTKKTALFLIGQTITLFGSMLVQYSISWHITLTTKSGLMLTIITICGFAPQILISLFAGVWADRYDRKKLIILSDSMIALSTAVLAVLFTLGYDMIWLLFVISAVRSVGSGIQTPAVSAFMPEIVPEDKLMRVNGINSSVQGAMMLVAPVAAGGLYAFMGLKSAFWIDVITAAIGTSMLLLVKTTKATLKSDTQAHVLREMSDGVRYVFQTKWLKQFLGFYLIYALMFGPVMFLTPLMVARSFGDESWRLVVHEVVFAAGMTAGGLTAGILANRFRNKIHMVIAACTIFGAATAVMGFSPNFWFYLVSMLILGYTMPFVNSGSITILQTKVSPEFIGRVFSLTGIIFSTAAPLSMAVFGPISDFAKVEILLIITGIAATAIALFTMHFKEMVGAGEPEPVSEEV